MIDPNLITTKSVGELPSQPITLDSLLAHELTGDLKKSTVNQLLQLLRPLVGKLQYEVVELDVNAQYIANNFDETGLGINLCEGFAICNGNNGTKNRDGRSSLAYGSTFNFPGVFGGFQDATLVEHNHRMGDESGATGSGAVNIRYIAKEIESNGTGVPFTDNTGVSGVNKNYHPYIVTLTIMKL
jgi:hypothetical protein